MPRRLLSQLSAKLGRSSLDGRPAAPGSPAAPESSQPSKTGGKRAGIVLFVGLSVLRWAADTSSADCAQLRAGAWFLAEPC